MAEKITLESLLAARNSAIAEQAAAKDALPALEGTAATAAMALKVGNARLAAADKGHAEADQAIHDLLVERGMHSLVDDKTGTVVIYAANDGPPGWFMTHPIPGKAS